MVPHVHLFDTVRFKDGFDGSMKEGCIVGITLRGLYLRLQNGTVFKKWIFIKNIENKYKGTDNDTYSNTNCVIPI